MLNIFGGFKINLDQNQTQFYYIKLIPDTEAHFKIRKNLII